MPESSLLSKLRKRARVEKGLPLPADEAYEAGEVNESPVAVAVMDEPEDEDEEPGDEDDEEPAETVAKPEPDPEDVTERATEDVITDPRFRTATADLVEARVSELLYDVAPDNRLVLKVVGATLEVLKSSWTAYNASRPAPRRIAFSAYVARRLDYCRSHNSEDKSLYLAADDISALDLLAGDNFQSAEQLVNWVRRVVTPVSTIEGISSGPTEVRFHPISADIYDRYASGCYPGENPVDRMSEDIDDFLRRKVGL